MKPAWMASKDEGLQMCLYTFTLIHSYPVNVPLWVCVTNNMNCMYVFGCAYIYKWHIHTKYIHIYTIKTFMNGSKYYELKFKNQLFGVSYAVKTCVYIRFFIWKIFSKRYIVCVCDFYLNGYWVVINKEEIN